MPHIIIPSPSKSTTQYRACVVDLLVLAIMKSIVYQQIVNSFIKTLSLCQVPCVSVPPILSYINLNCLSCGATDQNVGVLLFTNCGVLWSKTKL